MGSIIQYDFNKISDFLFQGSLPPTGNVLKQSNFDVLVLTASEWQEHDKYIDIEVIKAPTDDEGNTYTAKRFDPVWRKAGKQVADYVKNGKNVIVTCMAGHNRSGMVVAFALRELVEKTVSNTEIVKYIQSKRKNSLNNSFFVNYFESMNHE
jgi:protein-tyrosine phosphatase